jgi:hypothetical protein
LHRIALLHRRSTTTTTTIIASAAFALPRLASSQLAVFGLLSLPDRIVPSC